MAPDVSATFSANLNTPTRSVSILAGKLAPFLFLGSSLVLGAIEPGYSQWRNFVSQLTWGPNGWLQTANFLASGLLLIVFAAGLGREYRVLCAVVGVSLIVAGSFKADAGLGYPPGLPTAGAVTLHGAIHTVAALIAFVAIAGMCVVAVKEASGIQHERVWSLYSGATAWLALGFWIASIVSAVLDSAEIVPNAPSGLLNRAAIAVGVAWIEVLALRTPVPAQYRPAADSE